MYSPNRKQCVCKLTVEVKKKCMPQNTFEIHYFSEKKFRGKEKNSLLSISGHTYELVNRHKWMRLPFNLFHCLRVKSNENNEEFVFFFAIQLSPVFQNKNIHLYILDSEICHRAHWNRKPNIFHHIFFTSVIGSWNILEMSKLTM